MGIKFSHAKVNRRQHYFVIQLNKVLKLILNSVIRLIGYILVRRNFDFIYSIHTAS